MSVNLSQVIFSYDSSRKARINGEYYLKVDNLTINDTNEFIAIVGHTGSGKSTLTHLLNRLLVPAKGKLVVDEKEITKRSKLLPIRKKVGLVFQFPEYQLFEDTVIKDISFGPKNFKLDNPEALAMDAMKIMGITNLKDRNPFTLSGGQMRKVAIAGILASKPDILVLDEPTVGLDSVSKEELLEFLKDLNENKHISIILITHDMEVVTKYCKRAIVLKKGNILYDGDSLELFKDEKLIEDAHLDYPHLTRVMLELKKKYNLDIDPYKFDAHSAFLELEKALIKGEAYE